MKIINTSNNNYSSDLEKIIKKRSQYNLKSIDLEVGKIINKVIKYGDKALIYYAKKFDRSKVSEDNILLTKEIRYSYKNKIDNHILNAFKVSINNVVKFHKKQKPSDYEIKSKGVKTASKWKPIQSVGLYIPGGKAAYPSSVIMNVVPAKVAGVKRIVVATPSKSEHINPYVLAILDELNII